MVTNQDGLGTSSFPEETFWSAHNLMLKTLAGEGITFDDILIDRSFPEDHAPTRKPRTGMLTKHIDNPEYDLAGSFVIGDRPTDVELAKKFRVVVLSICKIQWLGLQEKRIGRGMHTCYYGLGSDC